jgi:hypothetical protein
MATNLRLDPRAVAALREAARRSGRSQQELLREAVDRFLGLDREPRDRDRAVMVGLVKAPTPFDDVMPTITLPRGERTLDLLDRDSAR